MAVELAQGGQGGLPGGGFTERWIREGQKNKRKEGDGVSGKRHSTRKDQQGDKWWEGQGVRAEARWDQRGCITKGLVCQAKESGEGT